MQEFQRHHRHSRVCRKPTCLEHQALTIEVFRPRPQRRQYLLLVVGNMNIRAWDLPRLPLVESIGRTAFTLVRAMYRFRKNMDMLVLLHIEQSHHLHRLEIRVLGRRLLVLRRLLTGQTPFRLLVVLGGIVSVQ